jgi:large subunit ribosomal protein L2
MALKTFRPMTSSQRGLVLVDRSELWTGKPEKALTEGMRRNGGRNNHGHITARHRGGGHKRRYRVVDFKRRKWDVAATVERLEYDPNRSAFIALVKYEDGELAYILAPQRLKVGDTVISGSRVDIKPGNAMPLENIPVGTIVHNVEMRPGKGGQIARSAGTYVQLVGKAGRSRWKGRRPKVRGVAMNPVDHPHGGGEGKTSGGRHPVTPWGKPTKGAKTRKNKRTQQFIVKRRR